MANKNVIIINGKHYDALSGKLLSDNNPKRPKARSFDGVSTPGGSSIKAAKKLDRPRTTHKTGHAHDVILSSAIHRKSMPKPLMRVGLKKPTSFSKQIRKIEAPTKSKLHQPETSKSNVSLHDDSARIKRSVIVSKSTQVKHFSRAFSNELKRSLTSPSRVSPSLSTGRLVDSVTSNSTKLQGILERGLQKASSHSQINTLQDKVKSKKKKSKKRKLNIGVLVIALLLIMGFVFYRNIPAIDVWIASSHAGIRGETPGYIPSGFKFIAPVRYGQGMITIAYTSANGSFRVVQQNSSWDSIGLKDSFVVPTDANFKVIQSAGRIIYLYSQGDATWVNEGVWYQITDNANLSTSDLVKIATSL